MSYCIYPCNGDARHSKSKYHIQPFSAGNQTQLLSPVSEYTLPNGLVCDKCNNYFGKEIEHHLTNHPFIKQYNAFYNRKTRKNKKQAFSSDKIKIYQSGKGLLILEGEITVNEDGGIRMPIPSTNSINHKMISRAIHKIAYECLILDVFNKHGIENVLKVSKSEPYSSIARYIRKPNRDEFRPYGVQASGAKRVVYTSFCLGNNDMSLEKIFNEYIGYILGFPGARFSCTLSSDSNNIKKMIDEINKYEFKDYLTTPTIIYKP